MKNTQKGFIVPMLIGIIALLIVGGGAYVYLNQQPKIIVANQIENNIATTTKINSPIKTSGTPSNNQIVSSVQDQVSTKNQIVARYAGISFDISELRIAAEIIRSKTGSYVSLCKNGFFDTSVSPEVQSKVQDILTRQGADTQLKARLSCASNKDRFAFQVEFIPNYSLPVGQSSIICMDGVSSGFDSRLNLKTYSCEPTAITQYPPHIDSVTPIVDINGNMQFTVTGTGFTGSRPYVDGQGATYSADSLTDTTILLISVKQLSTSGKHSVYLINSAGQKSNIVDFTK